MLITIEEEEKKRKLSLNCQISHNKHQDKKNKNKNNKKKKKKYPLKDIAFHKGEKYKNNNNLSIFLELEYDEENIEIELMFSLLYGIGTKLDRNKAKELCLKYADKDNLIALGLKYFCGFDCRIDEGKSFGYIWQYYKGNKKNSKNRKILGYCLDLIGSSYEYGMGIEKNNKKAKQYYMKGSKLNNCMACFNLAFCYEIRKGGKNKEKAMALYDRSAQMRYSEAILKFVMMCEEIKGKDMDHEKIASYLLSLIQFCDEEKKENIKKLKNILSERRVQWREEFHVYWNASIDLNQRIFILLMISKNRRHSKYNDSSFLVKGLIIKIIKQLCHI